MLLVDITVFGEVTLDTLDNSYCRPGGITYSALAGRCVGAKTAVAGFVGKDCGRAIRSFLSEHRVEHGALLEKAGPTTEFFISGSDEIEEAVVTRQGSDFPHEQSWDIKLDTRALLIYACPAALAHGVIDHAPGALVCFDLQYDMGPKDELEAILRRCNVVFVSRSQGMEYLNVPTVQSLADTLLSLGPTIVVIKCGLFGSMIFTKGRTIEIPRYESNWCQSVGAGDVYNAVFITEILQNSDPVQAGHKAAIVTACYCEGYGEILLSPWDEKNDVERSTFFLNPDSLSGHHVYLAGPFFNWGQLELANRTRGLLKHHGFKVYSPYHEDGVLETTDPLRRLEVYTRERDAISSSKAVVSILDGNDPGTLWETGYAVGNNIPVIGLWTSGDIFRLNLMPAMSVTVVRSFRQLILELLEATKL